MTFMATSATTFAVSMPRRRWSISTALRFDGMPFAGLKRSGYGVGGMPYTIADMQIEKMLVWNAGA